MSSLPIPDPSFFIGISRFSTYLEAANNDKSLAIDLYAWNAQLSGAFHEVLGHAEVAVRNAIDAQLRIWNLHQSNNSRNPEKVYTEEWALATAIPLHGLVDHSLRKAKSNAHTAKSAREKSHVRRHADITHDDLISQLSFGSWNRLIPWPTTSVAKPAAHLWDEATKFSFPNTKPGLEGIRQVKGPLNNLHQLRNRVAHYEPLLAVNANQRLLDIARLTGYISQDIADWLMSQQRVREVSSKRPALE